MDSCDVRSWCDLPEDLLELIIKGFDLKDIVLLGAVCVSWSSFVRKIPKVPLLLFTERGNWGDSLEWFYSLSDGKCFRLPNQGAPRGRCCGSFERWLIIDMDHQYSLLDPFSNTQILLPPLCEEVEGLRMAILSSAPILDSNNNIVNYNECMIVGYSEFEKLGFYRLGDKTWSLLEVEEYCEDFIFSEGRLYILTSEAGLIVWVLSPNPRCRMKCPVNFRYAKMHLKKLVESGGELLLIGETEEEDFRVFKLDRSSAEWNWVAVESLGDQMLFVSRIDSKSLSAIDFKFWGLRGNHIYFTIYNWDDHYHDLCAFNLEDREIDFCFQIDSGSAEDVILVAQNSQ
ncbi:putative F-box protein At4g22180 [Tasmannia lanceolata]|uniref:putative F-box protein At4g22180 n=1 Tax=Tasmannia lanceolata TaxID=3420 RepID=UPI0040636A01